MPKYVALMRWTDQGVRNSKDSPQRADAARQMFQQKGVQITDLYWTVGSYNLIMTAEAPDTETFSAAMLGLVDDGNVRAEILRAYTQDEFQQILAKVS